MRSVIVASIVPALFILAGCSGSDSSAPASATQDELRDGIALKDYSIAVGIVATGPDARKIYEDLKTAGAKQVGPHAYLAGLQGSDLELEDEDDAKEGFGVSCTGKEDDSTFRADTCSINAIVKSEGQEKHGEAGYVVEITGKLAKAVAQGLPRTSPAGLVGSMTTGSGTTVTCKTVPGPTGSVCTVKMVGAVESFDNMIDDRESGMNADAAKKIIKAFF